MSLEGDLVEFLPDPSEVAHITTSTEEDKIARLRKSITSLKPGSDQ